MKDQIIQLLIVLDALLLACAVVMGLGFILLAGGHALLMATPVGIVMFTFVAICLSNNYKIKNSNFALGFAISPLIFAPLWYGFMYKIVETNCHGWSCSW